MTPTLRLALLALVRGDRPAAAALTDDERADLAAVAATLTARIRHERADAARPYLTRLERVRAVLESP